MKSRVSAKENQGKKVSLIIVTDELLPQSPPARAWSPDSGELLGFFCQKKDKITHSACSATAERQLHGACTRMILIIKTY